MARLAFELSSISKFDICILQLLEFVVSWNMAKAPVLAAGFLQLLIVDTLGDQFSMWFPKLLQISDAEYFSTKLLIL